ncbi:hypothetical protein NEMBOFW57_003299 [Staphylotrichum longicolle]|uniref:Uncharacterized protein n=1 Tax=Staphylotrichum longicolle TaxID=669026 RepID=A0AAD4I5K7_9PEZI|nr:hypothetical protein NEMBOFW57_003299 [Staphylotrichum longicolle]
MKDSLLFNRWHFTIQEAQAEMAGATITYVSIFETANQVTLHSSAAPKDATPLLVPHPEQTLNAVLQAGALRSSLVSVVSKLNRLKHKRSASAIDISSIAANIGTPGSAAEDAASRRDRVFLSYALSNWLIHSTGISETDKKIYCLWKRLIEDAAFAETLNWSNTVLPVASGNGAADEILWAILHSHHPLLDVQLMKRKGKIKILSACLENVSSSMHLLTLDRRMVARLLTLALLLREHAAVVAQLLAMDPDASYVPLVAVAVKHSNPRMVSLLIKAGADTEKRVPLLSSLYALPNDPRHLKICYALITARNTPAKGWDRALELVLNRMVATRDPLHIRLAYLLLKKGASPDRCYGYVRAAALVTFQQHVSPQLFDAGAYLRPPLLWVAIHKAGMAIYNACACAADYNARNGSWLFVIANFAIGLLLRHTLAVVAVSAIPLAIAHWYAKSIGKVLRGLLYALSVLMPFTLAGNSMKMSTALDYSLFSVMWMVAFRLSKAASEN